MAGTLNLGRYRLYQEEIDRFRVELVSDVDNGDKRNDLNTSGQDLEAAVSRRLREMLGDVKISFENVSPWKPDGTGKTHTVFSRVPIPALSES
jgi:hypothetical protein